MSKIDTGQLPSRVTWLEDEQRQSKVSLTKLQQAVEQLWNLQRDRTLWQDEVDRTLVALRGQLAKTVGLDEVVRQHRDRMTALQEDYANHVQANEKLERLLQTESDRIRQSITEHWHRMELLQKQIEDVVARLGPVVDAVRRQQDSVAQLAQTTEGLQSQLDALNTRQQLNAEQLKRDESEIVRLERELEPLRKQDEVALVKVQILADQARRVDEQVTAMAARERILNELTEKLQVHQLEEQRVEISISELQGAVEDHARQLEDHLRLLKQLEEQRVALSDRIGELAGELADARSEAQAQLGEYQQMVEQQKIRELAEMERQIKEFKERLVRLRGKVS